MKKSIIVLFAMGTIIHAMWTVSFYEGWKGSQETEKAVLKRANEVLRKNIWMQKRLADCTECNLLHYSIIQECDDCKFTASKNIILQDKYNKLN